MKALKPFYNMLSLLIIIISIETNFHAIYSDHNEPSPNSSQILDTSLPVQLYVFLFLSLHKTNK